MWVVPASVLDLHVLTPAAAVTCLHTVLAISLQTWHLCKHNLPAAVEARSLDAKIVNVLNEESHTTFL